MAQVDLRLMADVAYTRRQVIEKCSQCATVLAQSILGDMYRDGDGAGVLQDYVEAHMWFNSFRFFRLGTGVMKSTVRRVSRMR